MKKTITYTAALFFLGFSVQAQTTNAIATNSSTRINTERQYSGINKDDSLCYRTDTETKKISRKKIPAEVRESFNHNFKNTKKTSWRIDLKAYAADFISNDNEYVSAYFNSKGHLLEFITLKENLNVNLLQQMNSQFINSELKDIMEVNRPNTNEVFYVVNIIKNGQITQHYIDSTGKIVD